jgi:nicotinate-nucleotide--dimethylbenzimidazole phosphoribosyltransferase
MRRPVLDPGLDPSRAADRAADPAGWRMADSVRDALAEVIGGRRDIRRFRPDAVGDELLERLLAAAHAAPSVGLSQPWRFIVVRNMEMRARVRGLAERERWRQASRFDDRAAEFLDQKIEGVLEAPVGICVCCVPPGDGIEVLGRATIPETDVYSTACAIENLWLTARAEGLGVGWVSFYRPSELRELLGIPDVVQPLAWLCVGWPDERPTRPGLERAGWAARRPLHELVMAERWTDAPSPPARAVTPRPPPPDPNSGPVPDAYARAAARDHNDELVKPIGSLGALEDVVERWAAATGQSPPAPLRATYLICAGDHGHALRGSSLFGQPVSSQVAGAAARGETAIGVLARARGESLTVADIGLAGDTPRGCVAVRVRAGTGDTTAGPAMTAGEAAAAAAAGARLAASALAATGADCLVLGEIGIGNTATAASMICALTGVDPDRAVGRGTGLDAQGLARKRELVARALDRHRRESDAAGQDAAGQDPAAPESALTGLGGLELAALVGAIHAAHDRATPVLLDGMATGAAALVAVRMRPACREWLFAGHRSAEPIHALVLSELGLEPLLDLRLRLGEGSGAALALGLIEQAGRLHREMSTFQRSGVDAP